MLQIVHRVVGGADDLHAEFLDQAAAAVFLRRQQRVRAVPDILGGLFAQDILDAEHAAQLQMRPVEHRVADAVFEARGKGQPLVMPARVAADELLVHAVGEHHAPLVVVAAEHQLADVFELMVFIDHARGDVAMIVINRHVFRVLVIQLFGYVIFKQKILIHKRFHGVLLLCFWFLPPSPKREKTGGNIGGGYDSFRRMPTFGIFHRLNPPQAATISNVPRRGRQRAEKSRGYSGKRAPSSRELSRQRRD